MSKSGKTVRWSPEGQQDLPAAEREVFLVTPATVFSRARFREHLTRQGLAFHDSAVLGGVLRQALGEIYQDNPDGLQHQLALLREYEAARRELEEAVAAGLEGEELRGVGPSEELAGHIEELEGVARRYHAGYAGRLADNEVFLDLAPLEAVRFFCRGWANAVAPVAVQKLHGQLTEACVEELVAAVGHATVLELGGFIMANLRPQADQVKNSSSPSSGANARKPSRTAKSTRQTPRPTKKPAATRGPSRSTDSGDSASTLATQ